MKKDDGGKSLRPDVLQAAHLGWYHGKESITRQLHWYTTSLITQIFHKGKLFWVPEWAAQNVLLESCVPCGGA